MKISNTADRLKEIMREQNIRQIDIIEKARYFSSKYDAQITKADLSQYVSGKVEPGQAKLFVLASALNVNEAWLMGYDVPKARNSFASLPHEGINDVILECISILAAASGYEFKLFYHEYQVVYNGCEATLSPKEVEDLANTSIHQIAYVMHNILLNRLKDNKFPIREDLNLENNTLLNAAHSLDNATDEEKQNDENIMDDENF